MSEKKSMTEVFGINSAEEGEALLRKAGIGHEGTFEIPELAEDILNNDDLDQKEKGFLLFSLGGFEATIKIGQMMEAAMGGE